MDADLHRGVYRADGRGEGADFCGVRHQSRFQGKADDGPCVGPRAPSLSRAAPLAATSSFEFTILVEIATRIINLSIMVCIAVM